MCQPWEGEAQIVTATHKDLESCMGIESFPLSTQFVPQIFPTRQFDPTFHPSTQFPGIFPLPMYRCMSHPERHSPGTACHNKYTNVCNQNKMLAIYRTSSRNCCRPVDNHRWQFANPIQKN